MTYYDFGGYAKNNEPQYDGKWVLQSGNIYPIYWCGGGWSLDKDRAIKYNSASEAKAAMRENGFTALVFPA